MPEIYKNRIIRLLKRSDYVPAKVSQLARTLGVDPQEYPQFKAEFEQLRQAGHVVIGAKNLVNLPSMTGQIVGTFRANPGGFGFVVPRDANSHGDLFIPPDSTAEAMTGDTVLAKVKKQGSRGGRMRYRGEIIQVLERAQNRFIGVLMKHPEGWLVKPDGKGFIEPISVDDVSAKGAREKDKILVEILTYPTERYLARGVIIEVLGRAGHYETEIKSIIYQYHLPGAFDDECNSQARQAASQFNPQPANKREDLTCKVIITIDPPDAKDFDDAISLEKDSEGNWVLGVHIADVSAFIPADSPLDIEAKMRGNSVYLPGRTIPMLPEILSNGICSLQPSQKRFALSVFITYDRDAEVIGTRFTESMIFSTERLTYQQADRILKGRKEKVSPEVVNLLKNMETLSRSVEQRKIEKGMLHLDMPEVELIMDKTGQVVDAEPADTSYPHTIIEMFMVEANEAVASFLDRQNVPCMRRIHPEPDELSMKNLSMLVKAFGYSLPKTPGRKDLQDLLEAVSQADSALAVNIAVLRSLEKAEYAPSNIGHYALASSHYCHFTSPIRRYADLLVHRTLRACLNKSPEYARHQAASQDLAEIGKHISLTERRAEDAEFELKTVLILQMLQKRIGEQFDAVVTGLTNFGVFAQSKKFGIEGLIRLEDLGQGRWQYDEKSQSVIGLQSGGSIRLGQPIKVSIVSVNVPARQLNLMPVNIKKFTAERNEDRTNHKNYRKSRRRK